MIYYDLLYQVSASFAQQVLYSLTYLWNIFPKNIIILFCQLPSGKFRMSELI